MKTTKLITALALSLLAGSVLAAVAPEEAAKQYAEAGASCLSVLTEETYFKGTLGYLKRMSAPGLPLLRKDFIFDRLQVAATAATPTGATGSGRARTSSSASPTT